MKIFNLLRAWARLFFLLLSAAMILNACTEIGNSDKGSEPSTREYGAGSCVPIIKPTEFIFLSWDELIDINAEDMLDKLLEPSTEWRMKKLAEAGFNTYINCRLNSLEEAETLLALGDKTGMQIILECPELHTPSQMARAVEVMSGYPSLYAYYVEDEPEVFEYPEIITETTEIYKYDSKHPCYVNLYPNYAWGDWSENKYLETLRHYLKNVPVSFLSFDYYPILMEDGHKVLRNSWYHNLEDIRTAANEANIPIWSFALSTPHLTYPTPMLADLRLQHFSNLVYGSIAFHYFTTRGIVWNDTIVSNVYPLVKQVNMELKQMEPLFLGADIKDIWHTGDSIPRGTKALTSYPAGISRITTEGEGCVVSYFTNKGKQYIAFVNRSCTTETTLGIDFATEAVHIAKDGTESPATASYTIEAGDIRIFSWE